MNYQAVARQDDGTPITDTEISVRFSIRSSEPEGFIQWQEEHLANTNQFGLFTLNIGEGISTGSGISPNFDAIPWGTASHYLQIDLLNTDGIYENMGVNQFLSVPYAFFAGSAEDVDDNDNDPNNETIDDFTFENDVLTITEAGEDYSADLGPRFSELAEGQRINLIQLVGDSLNIVEGEQSFFVNLSGLDSSWIETIDDFTFENDVLTITETGEDYSVDLGPRFSELDAGQRINLIQLVGDSLNIVEGAESFIVDLSGLDSAWTETDEVVSNTTQNIGVGTDNPQSTLHIDGSISSAIEQAVGPLVMNLDETQQVILANVTSGSVTLNLPSATGCKGRQYTIKTMGPPLQPLTSNCIVIPILGESIDNESDYVMNEFNSEFVTIISDGSNWWIIGEE